MSKELFRTAEVAVSAPAEPISLIDSIRQVNAPSKPVADGKKASAQVPIIIVPAAPTALLTLYNVQEFLRDSQFVPATVAKDRANQPKEQSILLHRADAKGDAAKACQIIDNPARLSLEDWSRVKAVFVQGPAWQFKGWKWENPVELFQNVQGFYLHYDDVAVDPNVAAWNVKRLVISRSKRHLDATAYLAFWSTFDKHF